MEGAKSLVVDKKVSKRDKYFSSEWLIKMLDACDSIRDKAFIFYQADTGLRVKDVVNSEIVHVNWVDCSTYTYDFKKDEWRHVFWSEELKTVLKMWLKHRQAVGIKDKRLFPFSAKTANRIVKHWALAVKFPLAARVGTHWLRHTFVRLSQLAGRDHVFVRQNTGDTYKTILEYYSGYSSEDMQKEVRQKPLLTRKGG